MMEPGGRRWGLGRLPIPNPGGGIRDSSRFDSGEGAELVDRDLASGSDVVAAVELDLPGDELAGGLAGEVGVEGPADDPPHGLPGDEGLPRLAGDRLQGVGEPLPDVAGHLEDAVGCGPFWEGVDGDGA